MDKVYSVSKVNQYIKNMFLREYILNNIWVSGEVSNCKYHSSGHIYFTIKDKTSQMACVMFAGQRQGLSFTMKDGQSINVHGSINVYERDGKYQIYAKEITNAGIGLLYEKFNQLKKKLEIEGLFDTDHKKPIQKWNSVIGIVTAGTGAAIQDIINISTRRNPYVQLILYSAKVQGDDAKESIAEGIEILDKQGVDVIIVGRGGGSMEDLWAFNEEIVARAIYECHTPVISAVGHETDTTIADFVADLRAPTPSAAAELAVYPVMDVLQQLDEYQYKVEQLFLRKCVDYKRILEEKTMRLKFYSPENQIMQKKQYCIDAEEKLKQYMLNRIKDKRHQFEIYVEKLRGLSPLDKLKSGFSYVEDENGKNIKSINDVSKDDVLDISVMDGKIKTKVFMVSRFED